MVFRSRADTAVVIVGAGPAGLHAAEVLALAEVPVQVWEAKPGPGRKLLVAGKSGLNVSNDKPLTQLLQAYGAYGELLRPMITAFSSADLRQWAAELGCETFVGSSGRIFPEEMHAAALLNAWMLKLKEQGVQFCFTRRWCGFDEQGLVCYATDQGQAAEPALAVVLACGGASWPQTGSDGQALQWLKQQDIVTTDFVASNAGVEVIWPLPLLERDQGAVLKQITIRCGDDEHTGDVTLTTYGMEGGPVYPLSPPIRNGAELIQLDLKPQWSTTQIQQRLTMSLGKQSQSNFIRKQLKLVPAAVRLLIASAQQQRTQSPAELAALVKALPLPVRGLRPVAEAISCAGGVSWQALDQHLMLKQVPGLWVTGEMVDWDAPTGGYLLQACMSMGRWAAHGVLRWREHALSCS